MARLPIPFDNPATYPGHSGVDYGKARGTVFRASGSGRVVTLGRNLRGGYYIWVQYDNGPKVGYHHMDSHDGCPRTGTRVSEGTPLGHVGNSGRSTGPHLHSEVDGHATTAGYWLFFDPNKVVGAQPTGGNSTPQTPATPVEPIESEEEEMKGLYYTRASDGKTVYALFNEVSGFYTQFLSGHADHNELATNWATKSWSKVSEGLATVIANSCEAVRP